MPTFKRKHILVDLDNVLYPFVEYMAMVMSQSTEAGSEEDPNALMNLYRHYELWNDWGIPKGQFTFWWERAIDKGLYKQGNPYSGGVTALWQLSDAEWDINIVTARLNMFKLHDQVVVNTAEWLKFYGIPFRHLTFTHDKWRIQADAIIDDDPKNLIGHNAPLKFLYPAPHNLGFRQDPKTHDFIEDGIVILGEEYPWSELVEQLGSGKVEE